MKKNEEIIEVVSSIFGVSALQLGSKNRKQDVTMAKIAYCGLVREVQKFTTINLLLGISTPSVKKFIKQCDELLKTDKNFAKLYHQAEDALSNL